MRIVTIASVLAVIAITAIAGAVSFMVGQQTRMPDSEVVLRVTNAVDERGELAGREKRDALAKQAAKFRKRIARVRHVVRKRGYRAGRALGYEAGTHEGYAKGKAAGYSLGRWVGIREGVRVATDQVTCSDDPDSRLPACSRVRY
jgi:flagellar biosynthesis/type III secretory pathway protein FliH